MSTHKRERFIPNIKGWIWKEIKEDYIIWIIKTTIFKLKNYYETVKMSDTCPKNRTEKLLASLFLLYLIQGYKKRIQSSIILNDKVHPWIYILINVTRRRNRTQTIFLYSASDSYLQIQWKTLATDSTYSLPKIMQKVLK